MLRERDPYGAPVRIAHYAAFTDRMDTTDPTFVDSFNALVNRIATAAHLPLTEAKTQAAAALAGQAKLQATVMGINDAFFWPGACSRSRCGSLADFGQACRSGISSGITRVYSTGKA
ncbi:hypothetical protein NLX71_17655 [Paenibacillus sp. MZ04-78.2]|uniref:hypothetical protein n=1 Tax=Paenibacillus sp. MZ04-78.2 TaxID=2962034 RepID=UPI0020B7D3D3|nr:hypothetical protein [Paenibacillus sp. MZ04-78.2]MCP3775101.1 hypothetical protein [Paenibacillus sp. MZ04-78.2]